MFIAFVLATNTVTATHREEPTENNLLKQYFLDL